MARLNAATVYRTVMSDEDIAEMNLRIHQRRQAAIAALGHRWLGYVAPKQAVEQKNVTPMKKRTAK